MHHFVNFDNVSNVMLSRNDIKLHVDSIILDKKKKTKKKKQTKKERRVIDQTYTYNYMVCSLFETGVGGVCFFEKGADSIFCYKNFQSA